MFEILEKTQLNPTVTSMWVKAPLAARKAQAGQFVILRADGRGERIPLTVADADREREAVRIIFQTVGAATMTLNEKDVGEEISDLVGPLGTPTKLDGLNKIAVIGGGVGCAIALPVAQEAKRRGIEVTSIVGFRTRDLVILEKEFRALGEFILMTDDGSYGEKGNVCLPLGRMLAAGERFDAVFTIGPLIMMKYVARTTEPYHIPTIASMNPIMIDGTGMCGCCRLTVGGEMKFACVDGPDFDAHKIDFDEAMARSKTYTVFEAAARERHCNLYKKEADA